MGSPADENQGSADAAAFAGSARVAGGGEQGKLDRHSSITEAFAEIVGACADQIQRSAALVLQAEATSDALHDMRIGVRKLRTALKVFCGDLQGSARAELEAELRWLQDETGPWRDWHIYVEQALVKMQPYVNSSDLALLESMARDKLKSAAERFAKVLREPRFQALSELLQHWRRQAGGLMAASGGLRSYARKVLKKRHRKVRADHRRLQELDLPQLHKLRIRVKNLRYTMELFATLGRRKPVKRYLRELKGLQHRLGTIHDAVVAQDLTQELRGSSATRDHASGLVQGWSAAVIETERAALLEAGTRVRKPPL